ncbi:unnamed protein product [Echinostoma caproni]|uniref:Chromosome partitioning protein ParA n=1 Tax=Echinostoma caproni TaxID=27848 RepID=A0A183A5N5_9TREM|nr:unnamed protein product [Echinostoma caproni]
MTPVSLEVTGSPVFMKHRIIPLGLREPVKKALDEMRNYIPVQMSKTVQKNPEDLNDYSSKPALITEERSFIQAAADVVIAHEL